MTPDRRIRGYYFITDAGLSRAGTEHDVRAAVNAKVTVFQYRDKGIPTRKACEEAGRLKALCGDALFIVNDRVDLALAVGAGGVHLGQDDMPLTQARRILGRDAVIGLTVHSRDEACAAAAAGADYVAVAPVFATTTKGDAGAPCGTALIGAVKRAVSVPVVAIGGITLENAPGVVAAGADALCAISAVIANDDPCERIRRFQELFTAHTQR